MAFFEFLGILVEASKIFTKNGKLMFLLGLLTLVISYFLFLFSFFSMKPLINTLIKKFSLLSVTDPGSPESATLIINFVNDFIIFLGFKWICIFINCIASLLLLTATVLASTMIYAKKDLSFKIFLSKALKSLKRPFITWYYTSKLDARYTFVFAAILTPLVHMCIQAPTASIISSAIGIAVVGFVIYLYFSVDWTLTLVVSIVEDVRGVEALGKAATIVKGSKRHGFLLNLLFTMLLLFVVLQGAWLVVTQQSVGAQIEVSLVWLCVLCPVRMFMLVAFTVFYFKCKKIHGENIEMPHMVEYTRISTASSVEEPLCDEEKFIDNII